MIIPVRCFSCGKPVAHLYEEYQERVEEEGEDAGEVLTDLGIDRYCCRALMLGQVDLVDIAAKFKKA